MQKLYTAINNAFVFLLSLLVKFYRYAISPMMASHCRFEPSCSAYMLEALQEQGAIKGLYLGIKRILRCHPWSPGGYDPVPKKSCCVDISQQP
ncbi:hypothetical protein SAMN05421831_10692 [Allopseudospirillum japonicum]|uniref:Putative membrane protein insertion efficiency factor n=1 Tax=Allopseudospirillum japonicum TaxID=64971 RepID=A0A1H6SG07_9GAMM|nr:membrane protein insertion efficiency factor YidD [Allopseudospirillum japonicum]SEI64834.1 hypothetical protein SAMN05421831_10692 [Allopseudospirillum japonicum]